MYKVLTRKYVTQSLSHNLIFGHEKVSDIIKYASLCLVYLKFVHHSGIVGFSFA